MSNFISIKWDRFLAEDEAEHFPWLGELQDTEGAQEALEFLQLSDNFKRHGSGAYRIVYKVVGDENYVVKAAADRGGEIMNKDDFETATKYPLIFPKAYTHADDFAWVVMEKVTVTLSPEEMSEVLRKSFSAESDALRDVLTNAKEWKNSQFNVGDPFSIMDMIMASFRSDRIDAPPEREYVTVTEALQKILAPISGPAYQELSKVMHEFEIDKNEIRRGNHGYDKEYNFKILDSSVFNSGMFDEPMSEARETEEEPDLIAFSEDLNDRITSLIFDPTSIEHLNAQSSDSEVTTVLDTGDLFADYDTINEVHLGIAINDQAQGDVKAFYLCVPEERSQSNLVIVLNIPRGYDRIEEFQEWLIEELEDALSHELQHSCDPTEMLTTDIPEGEEKWESLENIYKHFASDAETRGHLAGAKGRVRRSGVDINEIVTGKVNLVFEEALENGYTKEELMPVMQAIWEKWNNYLEGWNK